MQRFTELKVWQRSRLLAARIYEATKQLPVEERYGLSAQLRRASISVLANIAEGSKRRHPKDYAHFLNVAEGSVAEVECLVFLCEDFHIITRATTSGILCEADEVARMLTGLRRRVLSGGEQSKPSS